jgi:hypothetical protein
VSTKALAAVTAFLAAAPAKPPAKTELIDRILSTNTADGHTPELKTIKGTKPLHPPARAKKK